MKPMQLRRVDNQKLVWIQRHSVKMVYEESIGTRIVFTDGTDILVDDPVTYVVSLLSYDPNDQKDYELPTIYG